MPKWMHDRAEHILAKNPSMPKSEAFALATQQMHSLGKSPKGYGTAEGRATAKAKFDTPKDDRKTANPGHLESPKMAAKKDEEEKPSLLRRAAPVGAAAALAGLGTYGALRKFRPSAIPELRALQEKAKDKAFEVATSASQGRGLRSMLFGAKDIPSNLRDTVGGVARPGATVLQHTGNQATTHGAATINAGVLPGALDDKHTFSQVMQHGTGGGAGLEGAIPKTDLLKQRLREVPHEHLSKAYPTGYVIKPRTGSMSKAENLLTEATPADDPRLREALRNPGEFIIQEKIPIQKEFRVHLVNNVPFTASHRELPHEGLRSLWNKHMGGGGGAFVPVMGEERQRLMDFARNSTKHIGQTEGGNLMGQSEHLHHALDIARLPDGSFKVIESNPTPGTLMNPIVSRKLQHMVTGRVPKDVAALGGLGAAAGTGLAAHAIMNRDQEKTGEAVDEKKFKLQGHTTFQGLGIAIENRKGSVRSGVDRDGKPWRTEMKHPYGYIKGTKGADGEEIDVYVGPDKKAPEAHVVHQHKSNGKGYDEDKVMLGFPSLEAARKAYLAHYNSPKFLGPISSMPVEVLKKIMHRGEKLVPPKSEHLDKVASAFFDELMKLAMDYWDTTTGGKSPAVLQAMAAKQGLPSFSALRQQWDQNAAHALRRTDEVGQQVPAIRENLGKSDRQLEAEWAQRHVAQKEQAAAAANAAMPATGAHSPAAMRAQAAPPPPAALPHAPTSVALPPMHPRAAGVGPGGGGAPALPQAARAAQGALAANVKGPIIPRLPRPMAAAGALPAFHPKMKLGAIKEAITRSVREYQRGTPEQQAEIARASGQLGLKPRYVGDISEGGLEAGVDKMIGAAPGGPQAAMPSLQERLQGYKAQKAGLGLEGRSPSPGVIQSPQGRGILGVQAPASAPAAVPGANESGVLVRKLYKPDSPLHRGEFTPQVLQQKQEFTDRARALSPEARSMVPAMYGHQVLNADKGPELQRAVSFHEHVPQMTDVHGMNPQQVAAMKEHAQRTLLKPMEQQGMHMRDLISRKGDVNPGNLVMTPQGPKAIDFMPGDFRAGAGKSPMVSSMEKYVPSSEQSVFHEKGQLGQLRREVFNPQLRVQPGGALQGALPASPLNKALHPGATFVPEAARAAQGAMGKVLGKKPAVGAIGKALAHA